MISFDTRLLPVWPPPFSQQPATQENHNVLQVHCYRRQVLLRLAHSWRKQVLIRACCHSGTISSQCLWWNLGSHSGKPATPTEWPSTLVHSDAMVQALGQWTWAAVGQLVSIGQLRTMNGFWQLGCPQPKCQCSTMGIGRVPRSWGRSPTSSWPSVDQRLAGVNNSFYWSW